MGIVKISVVLFYRRIFITKRFRLVANIIVGICVVWTIAMFLVSQPRLDTEISCIITTFIIFQAFLLIMGPIPSHWNPAADPQIDNGLGVVMIFSMVSDIILDIITLCLPIRQIYKLNLNRRKKIIVAGIFWLGFFCVIASILRLYYTVRLAQIYNESDKEYSLATTNIIIWSEIEPCTSIIAACLPTLGLLFQNTRIVSSLYGRNSSAENKLTTRPKAPPGTFVELRSRERAGEESEAVTPEEISNFGSDLELREMKTANAKVDEVPQGGRSNVAGPPENGASYGRQEEWRYVI